MKTSERYAVKVTAAELKKLMAQVRAEYGEAAERVLLSEPTLTADFGASVIEDFAKLDNGDRIAARDTLGVLLASSPAKAEAEAPDEVDPLSFKNFEPTDNVPLPPLDTLSARGANNVRQIVTSWVWVTGIERFVNRLDATEWWKLAQFDSAFNSLSDKASIGRALYKEPKLLRKFRRAVYVPGADEIVGADYNLWRPSPIIAAEGNTELFNAHVNFLFDQEATQTIVLDWMAWVLQNLDRRPSG